MSDPDWKQIEQALGQLLAQQRVLLGRIEKLESEGAPRAAPESPRERLIRFLDEFRAGEVLGEVSLAAWIAVCLDAELRGGLRVVQQREAAHAQLLAERIRELGGAPTHELPADVHGAVVASSGSTRVPDADKVEAFVARFPNPERALAPILDVAGPLEDDPETRALLEAIAADERATLEFFYRARERLRAAGE